MFGKHSYIVMVTFTLISARTSVIRLDKTAYSVRKIIQIMSRI